LYNRNTQKNQKLVERQGAGSTLKLIVHPDNARPHAAKLSMEFMDANRMTRAPYPPYSPGLAPSDFFLSGDVKQPLNRCPFDHADHGLTAVQGILDGFDKPTLIRVFKE
jgi:hypothetical protein